MLTKIRYWSVYKLFRWQFIVLALGMFGAYTWLVLNVKSTGTDEWPRISEWLEVILFATIYLVAASVLLLLISWIYFLVGIKSGEVKISVQLPPDRENEAGYVPAEIIIHNVLRPVLGTIEVRILFSDWRMSDRILLDENKKTWLSPLNTVSGKAVLDLHHRGLNDIQEIQVILTDMMKVLSIPVTMYSGNRLLTVAKQMKDENFNISPLATEDQDVRINIPKRVQGEFLNYKDFESGDDIRRIVWKIYARSGELVVRVPETRDPYASHVYICMGFYNAMITDELDDMAGKELLNIYKDNLRQVYEAVSRNNYSVRIIHDQSEQLQAGNTEVSKDLYYISTAHWQNGVLPSETFVTPKTAVICLSSAVPAEEVEKLFSKLAMHVPVIVFGLSGALGPVFRFSLKRIFFMEKKHPLSEVRRSWWMSPLRKRLQLNEQRIRGMVMQRGNAWLMETKPNE